MCVYKHLMSGFCPAGRHFSALSLYNSIKLSLVSLQRLPISLLSLQSLSFIRTKVTINKSQLNEFYGYTSGWWLWNEDQQLQDWYAKFNIQELQQVAAKSVGAIDCVQISKLAEGWHNKVFRLIIDNGKVVIARIPNPNAGKSYLTTSSEVAKMDFVRTALFVRNFRPEFMAILSTTLIGFVN